MLDAFQAMNLEIMKNSTASDGEAAMLRYTLRERMQLSARISHLLSGMGDGGLFSHSDNPRVNLIYSIGLVDEAPVSAQ